MTRLKLLVLLSAFLKGIARPARLVSSDVQYCMILYAREMIRRRIRKPIEDFDSYFIKYLNRDVHDLGNLLLVKLSKEKRHGGEHLKTQFADLVLANSVIEKRKLQEYKKYFKGSRLTAHNVQRYNHAVLLGAVMRGFLSSLLPENKILHPMIVLDLSRQTISDEGMVPLSFRDQANHYIQEELYNAGMIPREKKYLNRSEVDYLHFSSIGGVSYQFHLSRVGLLPYLTGAEVNPL